jgi:hypothetical protein
LSAHKARKREREKKDGCMIPRSSQSPHGERLSRDRRMEHHHDYESLTATTMMVTSDNNETNQHDQQQEQEQQQPSSTRTRLLHSSSSSSSSENGLGPVEFSLPQSYSSYQQQQRSSISPVTVSAPATATNTVEQNRHHHSFDHQHDFVTTATGLKQRSNPIAIIRRQQQHHHHHHHPTGGSNSGDDNNNNNNGIYTAMDYDSDFDHDDDDNNDHDDDHNNISQLVDRVIERDAKKLQRKYGGTIVQTYQPPSVLLTTQQTRRNTRSTTTTTTTTTTSTSTITTSALNAPYLGSRSRSANQILSLPPMSLAGDTIPSPLENSCEELPLESAGAGVAYGSLRDSHERGRFLDGPTSYREPTSGKIRQLDHRLRYHGTGSSHQLSIGERLQQSRQLKEIRQRMEQQAQRKEGLMLDQKQSATTQSSLSAIMNEASKQSFLSSADDAVTDTVSSSWGEEILMPIKTDDMPTFFDLDQQYEREDTPCMLSTSMTAFEMLKMSNITSNFNTMSLMNPASLTRRHLPTSFVKGSTSTVVSSSEISAAATRNIVPGRDDQHCFQPLARSMSDPTPRLPQIMFPRESLRNQTTTTTTTLTTNTGGIWTTVVTHPISPGISSQQHQQPEQQQQQQQPPTPSSTYGYSAAPQPDHDPDTDGAFGDLDME